MQHDDIVKLILETSRAVVVRTTGSESHAETAAWQLGYVASMLATHAARNPSILAHLQTQHENRNN